MFAQTGVPDQIVSDNGTQFLSKEFNLCVKRNGINHVTSVHSLFASNEVAEKFIQTFKQAICTAAPDKGSLQYKIVNFLLAYRNVAHAATNQEPAMLFLGLI